MTTTPTQFHPPHRRRSSNAAASSASDDAAGDDGDDAGDDDWDWDNQNDDGDDDAPSSSSSAQHLPPPQKPQQRGAAETPSPSRPAPSTASASTSLSSSLRSTASSLAARQRRIRTNPPPQAQSRRRQRNYAVVFLAAAVTGVMLWRSTATVSLLSEDYLPDAETEREKQRLDGLGGEQRTSHLRPPTPLVDAPAEGFGVGGATTKKKKKGGSGGGRQRQQQQQGNSVMNLVSAGNGEGDERTFLGKDDDEEEEVERRGGTIRSGSEALLPSPSTGGAGAANGKANGSANADVSAKGPTIKQSKPRAVWCKFQSTSVGEGGANNSADDAKSAEGATRRSADDGADSADVAAIGDKSFGTPPHRRRHDDILTTVLRLNPHAEKYPTHRSMPITKDELDRQKDIRTNSKKYSTSNGHYMSMPFETDGCVALAEWQLTSYPTCNTLHEFDLLGQTVSVRSRGGGEKDEVRLLSSGTWRSTWRAYDEHDYGQSSPSSSSASPRDDEDDDGGGDRKKRRKKKPEQPQMQPVALKTYVFQSHREYDDWTYNQARKEALTYSRTTPSPHIVRMYGYCGLGGVFEYGPGGNLEDVLGWNDEEDDATEKEKKQESDTWTSVDKLKIALEATRGLADLHDLTTETKTAHVDKGRKQGKGKQQTYEQVAVSHSDVWVDQYIRTSDGKWKLNDFNRVYFMRWNATSNEPCGYKVDVGNPGSYRSPEEYRYDVQTDKVDIYALGSVLYAILTNRPPFYGYTKEEYKPKLKRGDRAKFPSDINKSTDPALVALMDAIKWCRIFEPEKRPKAREVADFLEKKLGEIEKRGVASTGEERVDKEAVDAPERGKETKIKKKNEP